MRRFRPSRSTRVARALTALIAVWCLGCSAFDPLLSRLAGLDAGTGMLCAGDGDASGVLVASSNANADAPASVKAADDDRQDVTMCGCQSCCAPAPPAAAPPLLRSPLAAVDQHEPLARPGPEREPLVPPPEIPA